MAEKTPHFGIEYFVLGDYYSGAIDKRRFDTIDQGMAFISDLIGPGVIQGWSMSVDNNLTLKVTEGWGMIGRQITKTYGDYARSLVDNSQYYIWMRGRPGVTGQLSGFSNIVSINYFDSTPPAVPANIKATGTSIDSLSLSWDANNDYDFSKFLIYRSVDNISYELIFDTDNNSYTDTGLTENKIYYYKIKSVDFSGNTSNFSSVLTTVTNADLSVPANPTNVQVVSGKNLIYLTWNSAAFGDISKYVAEVTPISVDGIVQGLTVLYEANYDKVDLTINNLDNDQLYLIVLKSVSTNKVQSSGVPKRATPRFYVGPPDILFINVIDYENITSQNRNGLNISWDLTIHHMRNLTV
jgi:chitodextrinase